MRKSTTLIMKIIYKLKTWYRGKITFENDPYSSVQRLNPPYKKPFLAKCIHNTVRYWKRNRIWLIPLGILLIAFLTYIRK